MVNTRRGFETKETKAAPSDDVGAMGGSGSQPGSCLKPLRLVSVVTSRPASSARFARVTGARIAPRRRAGSMSGAVSADGLKIDLGATAAASIQFQYEIGAFSTLARSFRDLPPAVWSAEFSAGMPDWRVRCCPIIAAHLDEGRSAGSRSCTLKAELVPMLSHTYIGRLWVFVVCCARPVTALILPLPEVSTARPGASSGGGWMGLLAVR